MPRVVEGMFAEGEKPVDPREPLLAQTRDNKNELDELFAGMSENIQPQQQQQTGGFTTNLLPQLQENANSNQEDWSEVWNQQKAKQLDETRTEWAKELWEQQKEELKTIEKHYDDVLTPMRDTSRQQQDPPYPTWNGLGEAPEFYRPAEAYQPEGGIRTDIQEETPLLANEVTQQQNIDERTNEAPTKLTEEFEKKAEISEPEQDSVDEQQKDNDNELGTTNEALPTWNGPGSAPEFYKEAEAYTPTGGEKATIVEDAEEKSTFKEQVKEKAAELGESMKETTQEAGHKIEEWKDIAFEKTADVKDVTTHVLANAATHVKDAALAVGHVVADTFNKITHRTPEEKKIEKTESEESDNTAIVVENKKEAAASSPELLRQDEFVDSEIPTNANLELAEGTDKGREAIAEGPQIQARDRASRRLC